MNSFKPLYSCGGSSTILSFFPLFQTSLFIMQWFIFGILFFGLDPFWLSWITDFSRTKFFEYDESTLLGVIQSSFYCLLVLHWLMTSGNAFSCFFNSCKRRYISEVMNVCQNCYPFFFILVQKILRTHEILSLIFFFLLFGSILKVLLGFRNAQEYWENLFEKNICASFFLYIYNNLLCEFLAQNLSLSSFLPHKSSPHQASFWCLWIFQFQWNWYDQLETKGQCCFFRPGKPLGKKLSFSSLTCISWNFENIWT